MSLWNKLKIQTTIRSPQRREHTIQQNLQRASFCAYQKASYSIEAAVVIPIFAAYLVMLLFFFSVLEIQCEIDEAILFAGRKTAVESSIVESEEALFLSAEAHLLYALRDNPKVEKSLKHGFLGISLLRSDFEGEDIILRADYTVNFPFSLMGIGQIKLSSQNRFRKWTGNEQIEAEEGYVYITKYGEVYHTNLSCRTLDLSVKETSLAEIPSLRGKDGQKYYQCDKCKKTNSGKEKVYYTDYGTLYHEDIGCSALKRVIEKIKEGEVGGRRLCSFCNE